MFGVGVSGESGGGRVDGVTVTESRWVRGGKERCGGVEGVLEGEKKLTLKTKIVM